MPADAESHRCLPQRCALSVNRQACGRHGWHLLSEVARRAGMDGVKRSEERVSGGMPPETRSSLLTLIPQFQTANKSRSGREGLATSQACSHAQRYSSCCTGPMAAAIPHGPTKGTKTKLPGAACGADGRGSRHTGASQCKRFMAPSSIRRRRPPGGAPDPSFSNETVAHSPSQRGPLGPIIGCQIALHQAFHAYAIAFRPL